jgi:hypothetical protein
MAGTDPRKFLGLEPAAARALAKMIDNIDDPSDPALLCELDDTENGELANMLAMMIDDDIPLSARALQRSGMPAAAAKAFVEAVKAREKLASAADETKLDIRLLNDDAILADLGRIPEMLDLTNPAPARDQFNANYQQGGGWRPRDGFTLGDDDHLGYPGDEPMSPIAEIRFRAERILFYEYAVVVIVQPDRSFEVCRMN